TYNRGTQSRTKDRNNDRANDGSNDGDNDGSNDGSNDGDNDGDDLTLNEPIVDDAYDGDTTVTGKGEPGSTVHVKDENGNEIGTGIVDGDGNFKVDLNRPLQEGMKLVVTQSIKDEDGNTVVSDPAYVTVLPGKGGYGGPGDSSIEESTGKTLPDTATSTFNWMMGGIMALFAGLAGLVTRRRK